MGIILTCMPRLAQLIANEMEEFPKCKTSAKLLMDFEPNSNEHPSYSIMFRL